jgi:hypothetical protein
MRKRLVAGFTVLAVVGLGTLSAVPEWRSDLVGFCRQESKYQGRYTNSWRQELPAWEVEASAVHHEGPPFCRGCTQRDTLWCHRPPLWREWVSKVVDLGPGNTSSVESPLLSGDPAALGVLVELLRDCDPKVRRIAVQGLDALGPAARPAAPALREALHDRDDDVRVYAEEILDRLDMSAFWADGE